MILVKLGGINSTANPTYTVSELAYQLDDCNAKLIVTVPESLKTAEAAAKNAGIPEDNILLLGDAWAGGKKRVQDIFSTEVSQPHVYTREQIWNQASFLVYSSGTTGE